MQQPPPDDDTPLPPIAAEAAPKAVSTLAIDWTLFENHLSGSDLTEEQKREFLETIWYIVVSFVDLGFGIAPVQQALMAGRQSMPALPVPQPAPAAPGTLLTATFGTAVRAKASKTKKPGAKPKTGTKRKARKRSTT